MHDKADPFGKLSRLLAVCSAAYKSALMEISEPMMARSSSRGRGRRLPGRRPSASYGAVRCGAVRLVRLSVSGVWASQADAGCAGVGGLPGLRRRHVTRRRTVEGISPDGGADPREESFTWYGTLGLWTESSGEERRGAHGISPGSRSVGDEGRTPRPFGLLVFRSHMIHVACLCV